MEWLMQWVENLAFYFIFLSALVHFIPGREERKYIRFFMGILLILLILEPILEIDHMGEELEQSVLAHSLEESFEEMLRETGRQEIVGNVYVKEACEREMSQQVELLLKGYGYRLLSCEISFFDGELLELQEISLAVERTEEAGEKGEVFLKNKLEEVYNIPEGNINISIQG